MVIHKFSRKIPSKTFYSYYIEVGNEVIAIDPLMDVREAIAFIEKNKLELKGVVLTGFFADRITGHGQLMETYPDLKLITVEALNPQNNGISIGDYRINLLPGPGVSYNHLVAVLENVKKGKVEVVFSGETIVPGHISRPVEKSHFLDLTGLLFDSLRSITTLMPKEVKLYPAFLPSNLTKEFQEKGYTLSRFCAENASLFTLQKEDYLNIMLEFAEPEVIEGNNWIVNFNRCGGIKNFQKILEKAQCQKNKKELSNLKEVKTISVQNEKEDQEFVNCLPGTLVLNPNLQSIRSLMPMVNPEDKFLLIMEEAGKIEKLCLELMEIGLFNLQGWINNIEIKNQKSEILFQIKPEELFMDIKFDENMVLIDLRDTREFAFKHIRGSVNIQPETLFQKLVDYPEGRNFYLISESPEHALLINSVMKANGYQSIRSVNASFEEIKKQYPDQVVTNRRKPDETSYLDLN